MRNLAVVMEIRGLTFRCVKTGVTVVMDPQAMVDIRRTLSPPILQKHASLIVHLCQICRHYQVTKNYAVFKIIKATINEYYN